MTRDSVVPMAGIALARRRLRVAPLGGGSVGVSSVIGWSAVVAAPPLTLTGPGATGSEVVVMAHSGWQTRGRRWWCCRSDPCGLEVDVGQGRQVLVGGRVDLHHATRLAVDRRLEQVADQPGVAEPLVAGMASSTSVTRRRARSSVSR